MLAVYFCTIFLLVTIQAKTLVIRDSEEVSTEDRAAHLRKIAAKLRAYITKVKGSSWVCRNRRGPIVWRRFQRTPMHWTKKY